MEKGERYERESAGSPSLYSEQERKEEQERVVKWQVDRLPTTIAPLPFPPIFVWQSTAL